MADVTELVTQLHGNIDSIHDIVQSLNSTKEHDAQLEALEREREAKIAEIKAKHENDLKALAAQREAEEQSLAEKRRQEEEELTERRRKEEEELAARRKREDEERRERVEREQAEREKVMVEESERRGREMEEKRKGIWEGAESELERLEDEMERKVEEGKVKLRELDEKRQIINQAIEEALNKPTVIPAINFRSRRKTLNQPPSPSKIGLEKPVDAPKEDSVPSKADDSSAEQAQASTSGTPDPFVDSKSADPPAVPQTKEDVVEPADQAKDEEEKAREVSAAAPEIETHAEDTPAGNLNEKAPVDVSSSPEEQQHSDSAVVPESKVVEKEIEKDDTPSHAEEIKSRGVEDFEPHSEPTTAVTPETETPVEQAQHSDPAAVPDSKIAEKEIPDKEDVPKHEQAATPEVETPTEDATEKESENASSSVEQAQDNTTTIPEEPKTAEKDIEDAPKHEQELEKGASDDVSVEPEIDAHAEVKAAEDALEKELGGSHEVPEISSSIEGPQDSFHESSKSVPEPESEVKEAEKEISEKNKGPISKTEHDSGEEKAVDAVPAEPESGVDAEELSTEGAHGIESKSVDSHTIADVSSHADAQNSVAESAQEPGIEPKSVEEKASEKEDGPTPKPEQASQVDKDLDNVEASPENESHFKDISAEDSTAKAPADSAESLNPEHIQSDRNSEDAKALGANEAVPEGLSHSEDSPTEHAAAKEPADSPELSDSTKSQDNEHEQDASSPALHNDSREVEPVEAKSDNEQVQEPEADLKVSEKETSEKDDEHTHEPEQNLEDDAAPKTSEAEPEVNSTSRDINVDANPSYDSSELQNSQDHTPDAHEPETSSPVLHNNTHEVQPVQADGEVHDDSQLAHVEPFVEGYVHENSPRPIPRAVPSSTRVPLETPETLDEPLEDEPAVFEKSFEHALPEQNRSESKQETEEDSKRLDSDDKIAYQELENEPTNGETSHVEGGGDEHEDKSLPATLEHDGQSESTSSPSQDTIKDEEIAHESDHEHSTSDTTPVASERSISPEAAEHEQEPEAASSQTKEMERSASPEHAQQEPESAPSHSGESKVHDHSVEHDLPDEEIAAESSTQAAEVDADHSKPSTEHDQPLADTAPESTSEHVTATDTSKAEPSTELDHAKLLDSIADESPSKLAAVEDTLIAEDGSSAPKSKSTLHDIEPTNGVDSSVTHEEEGHPVNVSVDEVEADDSEHEKEPSTAHDELSLQHDLSHAEEGITSIVDKEDHSDVKEKSSAEEVSTPAVEEKPSKSHDELIPEPQSDVKMNPSTEHVSAPVVEENLSENKDISSHPTNEQASGPSISHDGQESPVTEPPTAALENKSVDEEVTNPHPEEERALEERAPSPDPAPAHVKNSTAEQLPHEEHARSATSDMANEAIETQASMKTSDADVEHVVDHENDGGLETDSQMEDEHSHVRPALHDGLPSYYTADDDEHNPEVDTSSDVVSDTPAEKKEWSESSLRGSSESPDTPLTSMESSSPELDSSALKQESIVPNEREDAHGNSKEPMEHSDSLPASNNHVLERSIEHPEEPSSVVHDDGKKIEDESTIHDSKSTLEHQEDEEDYLEFKNIPVETTEHETASAPVDHNVIEPMTENIALTETPKSPAEEPVLVTGEPIPGTMSSQVAITDEQDEETVPITGEPIPGTMSSQVPIAAEQAEEHVERPQTPTQQHATMVDVPSTPSTQVHHQAEDYGMAESPVTVLNADDLFADDDSEGEYDEHYERYEPRETGPSLRDSYKQGLEQNQEMSYDGHANDNFSRSYEAYPASGPSEYEHQSQLPPHSNPSHSNIPHGYFASLVDTIKSDIPAVSQLVHDSDEGHHEDEYYHQDAGPHVLREDEFQPTPLHEILEHEEEYEEPHSAYEADSSLHIRTHTADTVPSFERYNHSDDGDSTPATPIDEIAGRAEDVLQTERLIRSSWPTDPQSLDVDAHDESHDLKSQASPLQADFDPFSPQNYNPAFITPKTSQANFHGQESPESDFNSSPGESENGHPREVEASQISQMPSDFSHGPATSPYPYPILDSKNEPSQPQVPPRSPGRPTSIPPPPRSPGRPTSITSSPTPSFFQKTRSLFEASSQPQASPPPPNRPLSSLFSIRGSPSPPPKPLSLKSQSRPSSLYAVDHPAEELIVPRSLDADGKPPSPGYMLRYDRAMEKEREKEVQHRNSSGFLGKLPWATSSGGLDDSMHNPARAPLLQNQEGSRQEER